MPTNGVMSLTHKGKKQWDRARKRTALWLSAILSQSEIMCSSSAAHFLCLAAGSLSRSAPAPASAPAGTQVHLSNVLALGKNPVFLRKPQIFNFGGRGTT